MCVCMWYDIFEYNNVSRIKGREKGEKIWHIYIVCLLLLSWQLVSVYACVCVLYVYMKNRLGEIICVFKIITFTINDRRFLVQFNIETYIIHRCMCMYVCTNEITIPKKTSLLKVYISWGEWKTRRSRISENVYV